MVKQTKSPNTDGIFFLLRVNFNGNVFMIFVLLSSLSLLFFLHIFCGLSVPNDDPNFFFFFKFQHSLNLAFRYLYLFKRFHTWNRRKKRYRMFSKLKEKYGTKNSVFAWKTKRFKIQSSIILMKHLYSVLGCGCECFCCCCNVVCSLP